MYQKYWWYRYSVSVSAQEGVLVLVWKDVVSNISPFTRSLFQLSFVYHTLIKIKTTHVTNTPWETWNKSCLNSNSTKCLTDGTWYVLVIFISGNKRSKHCMDLHLYTDFSSPPCIWYGGCVVVSKRLRVREGWEKGTGRVRGGWEVDEDRQVKPWCPRSSLDKRAGRAAEITKDTQSPSRTEQHNHSLLRAQ